jgi:hypothetical protein
MAKNAVLCLCIALAVARAAALTARVDDSTLVLDVSAARVSTGLDDALEARARSVDKSRFSPLSRTALTCVRLHRNTHTPAGGPSRLAL